MIRCWNGWRTPALFGLRRRDGGKPGILENEGIAAPKRTTDEKVAAENKVFTFAANYNTGV